MIRVKRNIWISFSYTTSLNFIEGKGMVQDKQDR